MILIDDHTGVNLDNLAMGFYHFLNPMEKGNYVPHSIIRRIERKRADDRAGAEVNKVAFWDYLLANNHEKLVEILSGRPPILKARIDEINATFGAASFSNHIDYNRATLTPFGREVAEVFRYDTLYRRKPECEINCNQFNLRYCPYCNETPVSVITIPNNLTGAAELLALHQLDHFYPVLRHPYLALSFFNLIPGCPTCNSSQLKGEKQFDIDTHFNPFNKRVNDYFQFELNDIIINSDDDVIIGVRNKQPYAQNHLDDFRILTRYNANHREIINKLVTRLRVKSPKIQRSLGEQFDDFFGIRQSSTDSFLDLAGVPKSVQEINSLHIGKLKRDICIQMDIILP